MPRSPRSLAVVFACASLAAAPALADLKLGFDVTTRFVPAAGPKGQAPARPPIKGPSESKADLVVVLATDQVVVGSGGTRIVYDFKAKRIDRIEADGRSYSEESLFPVLGFRVMEFQNRRNIASALAGAAVKADALPIPLGEHLFSLDDPGTEAKIGRKVDAGTTTCTWEGRPLAAWGEQVVPVPADDRARFVMFLRYVYGGHPEVLSDLRKLAGIPARLTLTIDDLVGVTTTTLVLKSHAQVEGPAYSLAGLRKISPSAVAAPLGPLLSEAGGDGPADHARRAEAVLDRLKRALADKKGLDAFLALTEFGIQTGNSAPGVDQAQLAPLVGEDPDLRTLLSALQTPADEKAAAAEIKALQGLRPKADARGAAMLKVFEANNTSAAGDLDRAEALFVEAISANRSLAGAWKDLGDLRFRAFDMQGAWLCWDVTRSISPKHPLVKGVNDFERKLKADHPEYFVPGP